MAGVVVFAGAIAVLSLSDRAPDAAFWRIKWAGRTIESRSGLDLLDRADIPWAGDIVGHFLLWGLAGAIGWLVLGRRDSGLFLIASLSAFSAGIEFVQPLLSSTRDASYNDLVANVLGITAGVVGAWMLTSSFHVLRDPSRSARPRRS